MSNLCPNYQISFFMLKCFHTTHFLLEAQVQTMRRGCMFLYWTTLVSMHKDNFFVHLWTPVREQLSEKRQVLESWEFQLLEDQLSRCYLKQYPPGPIRTEQDPAGPSRTHQDPPGPSKDPPGPTKTHQDPAISV